MASKDAAAPTNADLFGDTDSSDESVGATTKTTVNNNAPATANDNDDDEAAPQKGTHDEETIREDTKMADDSDDDEAEVGQKKSSSTNDNNNDSSQKTDNAALFGDDDSSSEDDEFQDDGIVGTTKTGDDANNNTPKDPPALKTMNQTLGLDSDSDEDDNANMKEGGNEDGNEDMKKAVYVPPRKMELLNLHPNKHDESSSNTVYHTVKLPNLVGINTTPYNFKTHDAKSEEEYYQGYVHNMIRWRYKYDEDTGELQREEDSDMLVRESNTRLVKWSDGSYTLHVGKEVLEVDNLDSCVPMEKGGGGSNKGGVLPGFSGINGYLYASQKARIRPPTKKELEGPSKTEDDTAENKAAGGEKNENNDNENDNNDDEVPPPTQPGGTVLECLGPISSRFAPRPSSLTSSAHRNLTLAVRQRNVKRARIAEIVTDFDPESEKAKRIKSKDDLAKSSRSAARSGAARRSGGGGGGGRRRGMNASYLEDDDDYDGVNLGRLKRQTMRGDRDNYSDEEEELDYGQDSASSEEDEWSKKKTQKRGAAAARAARKESEDDSSEDGEVVFGDDDDDDDEGEALIKKRVNTKAKAVLDDDDDDE